MNRMTLLIATGNTSCARLSVSKNKVFISQTVNYQRSVNKTPPFQDRTTPLSRGGFLFTFSFSV